MALPLYAIKLLAPHLKGAKVLCLGYPDLLATPQDIEEIFGVVSTRFTNRGAWHTGSREPLPETVELFDQLGASFECVDITRDAGVEKIADLNAPHDLGKFDLVIDPGTIEHCFNIGQAVLNAANAVRLGGRIFHIPPMTMLNHGFYNICPTMLFDFYTQNGWTVEHLESRDGTGNVKMHSTGRFRAPPEASLYCISRRDSDKELRFPVQTKYIKKMAAAELAAREAA